MRRSYDAVIVGGGHNGLVAAAYLARAGWEVLLVERNEEVGGAVASAEATAPGYVHDLYATNMNLFLGSAVFAELGEEPGRPGPRVRGHRQALLQRLPGRQEPARLERPGADPGGDRRPRRRRRVRAGTASPPPTTASRRASSSSTAPSSPRLPRRAR